MWSLRFRDAVAENAFVRSRHDKMMLNSRYVALFAVVCLLPDFVRYTQRELQYLDRDAYYAERSGGPNGEQGSVRHIVIGVSLVILLGAALLTWLPCTKQRIGVRCWEAFWIGVLLLAVMSGAVETFEDLTDSYRVKQLCDSRCCHNLHAKHANLYKLKFALALDVFVTVAHLALPVRWNIMVLFDALTMVIFSVVFSVDSGHFDGPDGHGDGLSGAVENLQAELFV
jgi:hypothetical protein